MGTRLDWEKKKAPFDALKKGADDDAPTPFWQIKKHARAQLVAQHPELSYREIERRLDRVMNRGMRSYHR